MTNDGANTITYDAENRAVTSAAGGTTTTYMYDGSILRAKKQVGAGTATVYVFSGSKVIAEYAAGAPVASPQREYIYSGSQLVATIEGSTTKYHHNDHLSLRVTTDSNGVKIADSGHYPYGESWYESGGANKLKFTSYARDNGTGESGNDYAMFRSYVNRLGRFSSPDPIAGSISDPQSLNRYAYTLNNPTNLADPLGLFCYKDTSGSMVCATGGFGGGGVIGALLSGDWSATYFVDAVGFTPDGYLPGTDLEVGNYWATGHWEFSFDPSDQSGGGTEGGGGDDQKKKKDKKKDKKKQDDCRAQMRYRRGNITPFANHTWWYVTNDQGQDFTLSFTADWIATPTGPASVLNAYAAEGPQSSSNADDNLQHGKVGFDSGPSAANCAGVNAMIAAAQNFPKNQVPYGWKTSNSGAHYLGTVGGFSPLRPPRALGWNVPVP